MFKIRYSTNIDGTHAYVVTNKVERKLLVHTSLSNLSIDLLILFDRCVNFYISKAKLCTAGEIGSVINDCGDKSQGY